MPLIRTTRAAQYVMSAEFTFTLVADTMVNTSGALDNFTSTGAHTFDVAFLPPGITVVDGEVVTETAVTGSTAYNISIGDSANPARYLATTDRVLAGRTALTPTGYIGLGENLRMVVTPTVAAGTAGKITVRVRYTLLGRTNEVNTA